MDQEKDVPQLPSLWKILEGCSEEEIREAEENLIAYAETVAEIVMEEENEKRKN